MMAVINDVYLNCFEKEGFLIDMEPCAEKLSGQTPEYFFAPNIEKSFKLASTGTGPYNKDRRAEIAKPTLLGQFATLEGDRRNICHHAIIIKNSESWHIGLPHCFAFALPLANTVADDVLSLYGPKHFYKSQISLFSRRCDIEPGKPGRSEVAAKRHNHTVFDGGTQDILYIATDSIMPTPFELTAGGPLRPTQDCTLTRFGAEVEHCSPLNNTQRSIRRTLALFYVRPGQYVPDGTPNNIALDHVGKGETSQAFLQAADEYLQSEHNTFKPFSSPIPLEDALNIAAP